MKRFLVSLALVGASFFAHAAAPSTQSIEKLLAATQTEKIIESFKPQVLASMGAAMARTLQGRQPTDEEQKVIDVYAARASKAVTDSMTMDRLKPLYVQLFTQYFTQKDVDGMIRFYQSPAGKSMIDKMPQLMQGLMAAMPTLLAPVVEQVQAASMQMANELEALQK